MNQTQPPLYLFFLKKDLTKTRYVVVLSFMFVALGANAQFKKGDKYLGGSISFDASSFTSENPISIESNTKSRSFSIWPTAGFFLNDKWVIGGGLGYYTSSQRFDVNNGVQRYRRHSFSVNMLSRRYFVLSDKFYFALEGSLVYGRGQSHDTYNQVGEKVKSYSTGINVRPLFVFFPSDKWGIEAGIGALGYSYSRNLTNKSSFSNFSAHYSGFNLGFAYYFRKAE